jgi:hypothetical protein
MVSDKEKVRHLLESAQRQSNLALIERNRQRYELKRQARRLMQQVLQAAQRKEPSR